jgi:hypothetical protein
MGHVSKALIGVGTVVLFVVVGCGGSVEAPGGGSAGSGGSGGSGGTGGGGSSGSGGAGGSAGSGGSSGHCNQGADCADSGPPGCPATPPHKGEECAGDGVTTPGGLECEYGASANPACNEVWECTSDKWQNISMSVGTCPMGFMCPATYAAANADHGMCSPNNAFCVYPEGTCICTTDPGGLPLVGGPEWGCTPVSKGCPAAPPQLGSRCTAPASTVCDYGGCSGGVFIQCTDGYWALGTMEACPA